MNRWRSKSTIIGTVLLLTLILVACGGVKEDIDTVGSETEDEKVYVLEGTTALPEGVLEAQPFFLFQEKIEENSNGRIKLEYRGGPEAIPGDEAGEAVRSGAITFSVLPSAYYASTVPEVLALSYSEVDTQTELERGAIDFLDEIHQEKLNAKLLGRGAEVKFNLYLKDKIETHEDLEGLRIRGTPTYEPMLKAVGAEMVSMSVGETYEAIDKGVIDGFGWSAVGITDNSLEEKINYKLSTESEFYRMDVTIIVNLDMWNELPEDLQEIMIQTQREVEEELVTLTQTYKDDEAPTLEAAGVEDITLDDDFLKIVNEAGWEFIRENVGENADKLVELFRE